MRRTGARERRDVVSLGRMKRAALVVVASLLAWTAAARCSAVEAQAPPAGTEAAGEAPKASEHPHEQGEEHGLPASAVEIARPFGFPVTNSMAVSWVVALALIVFAQVATREMKRVPDGAQNFLEWLVAGLYGLLEGIIGPHLV